MKKRKGRKKRARLLPAGLLLGLFLACLLTLGRYLGRSLMPSLRETAVMQANSLASDILAEAMEEAIRENQLAGRELVTYYRDAEGKLFAYSVDTVTINLLTADVIRRMNERVADNEEIVIRLPLGGLLHNAVLAAWGWELPIRVRLSGNTGANYEREFVDAGIHEINHRIWIRMEVAVQVSAPLLSEVLTSYMDFTLVDQVLSGDTPLTYLGVAP